jgi:putative ABC transport system permease protein
MLPRWLARLAGRAAAPSGDEIDRELRDHLELEAESLGGADGARGRARRQFGNVTAVRESVREVWHWAWLEHIEQDVRHGWRALVRSPAYSIAVVVTLSLGTGAGAAMFSFSEALHRPFPQLPQDRLVWITQRSASCPDCGEASPAALVTLMSRARSTQPIGVASWRTTLRGAQGSEMIDGFLITPGAFTLLGAPFALGHGFAAGAERSDAPGTTVLSYRFWHDRFGASPGVLDSVVTLEGRPYTVIGVLARDIVFPMACDVYAPLALDARAAADYGSHYLQLFARLVPGATVDAARAEAGTVAAQLARESPRTDSGWVLAVRPVARYHTDDIVIIERIAGIAALLVFVAACMSAANLALSRLAARRGELALRGALGVRRWRLARHLLTEALLLSLAAGAAGVALAFWAVHALRGAMPADFASYVPGWARLSIDASALAFAFGTSLLAMAAFALLPVVRATRLDLAAVLADGGRASTGGVHGSRTRSTLVVGEVAIAIALLTAAALFTQSVRNMLRGDPGVRVDHALVMHLSLPSGLADSAAADVYRRLDENLHATRGVRAAGITSTTPLSNNFWGTVFEIPGQPPQPDGHPLSANDQHITPDYARASGLRLVAGRMIALTDAAGAPRAIVVNEKLAQAMWPGASALGRAMKVDGAEWTVVGVVADVHHGGFDEPVRYTMYRSLYQSSSRTGDLAVWTEGDPAKMRDVIQRVVARTDPAAAVGNITTMEAMEARHVSAFRMMAAMLGVLAVVTMTIAVVGLYGLIAYGVAQRTREIGVRMALGARPADILSNVAGGALKLAAFGVALGIAGALAFARLLTSMLYGVTASDPATFVGVAGGLLAVALVAALVPSWRAAQVDPTVALRA